ncbi:DNA methyltransferase [Moraxella oblonga]|uniref:DNA methyltransferase n=1 Tax=Moraxella oblonga TaxID=200413 RepID=UPI00082AA7EF|nr:DNA methyltransferase [Moraxella oblonga]
MSDKQKQVKSKKRVADFGEVFTAEKEVRAMLDLVKIQSEQLQSRFLEPACGTGNFLVEILKRKLNTAITLSQINKSQKSPKYAQAIYEKNAIIALSSIYGIELLADNCAECRSRLFTLFKEHYQSYFKQINEQVLTTAHYLLNKNIVNGNALDLKDLTGNPIVFSEWTFISDIMIQRRDFIYEDLVEKTNNISPEETGFIAKNIKDYHPIHYLKLSEQENV